MNLFNKTILNQTFNNISTCYTINKDRDGERTIKGFLTNPSITSNSKFNFHSLDKFKRGEFLIIGDSHYLVYGDVINERVQKYKSEIVYCNWNLPIIKTEVVLIGTDNLGRPITEERETLIGIEYGFYTTSDKVTNGDDAVNLVESIYTLAISDTPSNREYFTINTSVKFDDDIDYRIINRNFAKNGLIELTLQR